MWLFCFMDIRWYFAAKLRTSLSRLATIRVVVVHYSCCTPPHGLILMLGLFVLQSPDCRLCNQHFRLKIIKTVIAMATMEMIPILCINSSKVLGVCSASRLRELTNPHYHNIDLIVSSVSPHHRLQCLYIIVLVWPTERVAGIDSEVICDKTLYSYLLHIRIALVRYGSYMSFPSFSYQQQLVIPGCSFYNWSAPFSFQSSSASLQHRPIYDLY